MEFISGNSGPKVRSDCEVRLEPGGKGINISLNSRVKTMYGASIEELCRKVLDYYGMANAKLEVNDSGALPFVIMARLEAVIKSTGQGEGEYIPEMISENNYGSEWSRFRFSRLYLPGNTPSMMLNAGLHKPDGIILDLEDSVAPAKKNEARILVRNALRQVNFYGAERMVRINQGRMGIEDLDYIVPHNVHVVLLPKCESAEYVRQVEERIKVIQAEHALTSRVFLMPIIESALGVENAFLIATASTSVVAMAIGLEDYTADLGVQRSTSGEESLYARLRIVNACKAAGIQPIDSVFSDVSDMEALARTVRISRSIGFEGMGCIHPRQISVIQKGFIPEREEIDRAARIVLAFREAERNGLGVVSLGSKMIDPPVVKRAEQTIALALKFNLLTEDWDRAEDDNRV